MTNGPDGNRHNNLQREDTSTLHSYRGIGACYHLLGSVKAFGDMPLLHRRVQILNELFLIQAYFNLIFDLLAKTYVTFIGQVLYLLHIAILHLNWHHMVKLKKNWQLFLFLYSKQQQKKRQFLFLSLVWCNGPDST